jgi:hypothetical protein
MLTKFYFNDVKDFGNMTLGLYKGMHVNSIFDSAIYILEFDFGRQLF